MTGWVEARRSTQISTQNLGRDHGIRRPPGAQQGGPLPRHVQGRGRLSDPAARYTDLGAGYYQTRLDTDRKIRNHIRQIQALGFDVTITKAG